MLGRIEKGAVWKIEGWEHKLGGRGAGKGVLLASRKMSLLTSREWSGLMSKKSSRLASRKWSGLVSKGSWLNCSRCGWSVGHHSSRCWK